MRSAMVNGASGRLPNPIRSSRDHNSHRLSILHPGNGVEPGDNEGVIIDQQSLGVSSFAVPLA